MSEFQRVIDAAAAMPAFRASLELARTIPGWTSDEEMLARIALCYDLGEDAVVVEIGALLGRSTVLCAAARTLRGSGMVHCVDPFDASGDGFSVPFYEAIQADSHRSLRERFDDYLRRGGVSDRVSVHQGTAEAVARDWTSPIDLLLLDGDQSPAGARAAFDLWSPFLKPGGVILVNNSADRPYADGHDGYRRVVVDRVHPPAYTDVVCIGQTTVARVSAAR